MEPISRRTVLRGAGVTMALPLLEAMLPSKSEASGAAPEKTSPTRLAVLYMPNGVNPHHWTPAGKGTEFALSELLAPLAKVKGDVNVLSELMNHGSIEGDGHYYKVAPLLTGTTITKTTGKDLRCGAVSLDQLVAQRLGHLTPLPSLELSVDPPTTYIDTNVGLTALYGAHISWSTPTTPVTREINPQLAFDRLFKRSDSGAKSDPVADKSVLDAVLSDSQRLSKQIGSADRAKLAEYLDAVRSVEKRIAFDAVRRRENVLDEPLLRGEIDRLGGRIKSYYDVPAEKRGIDHTEQVRILLDTIALAFWSDSTRAATFMFGNEVSGRNFAFLEGVTSGHHQVSHHENDPKKLEEYKRIGIWHVAQYAYLLERLKGMQDGVGKSVLDNSMVLFASGMRDGNAHSPYNLPMVLGGRGGGTIATGRHLTYAEKTPLCNLHLALLRRMGVPATRFGDSVTELAGLADPQFSGV